MFVPQDCEEDVCLQGDVEEDFCGGLPSRNLVFTGELPAMPGCSSPFEKVVRAYTWARSYADRKEAQKAVSVARYNKRRSAVVEVIVLV